MHPRVKVGVTKRNQSMFSVFKSRSFAFLWTAQLISSIGSALTTLAASILVFRVTGSTLSVGLMLIATAGPTVLVGLLAGVFVDRYNRKRIMLGADLLRAFLIFLIPFLVNLNILWLYIIVALSSSITQFFDSAHASVLPETATDEDLAAANALMAVSTVGATMFGFAAAGLIVSNISVEWAFYLDAFSFVISACLILFTHVPSIPIVENTSVRAIADNLKAGLRAVGKISILRSLFLVAAPIFLIFGFQNTLFLPFAIKVLGGTEFHFGLQQAAEATGIALGSFVMARLADRIREGQWLAISYLLMALGMIGYSYSRTIAMGIFLVGLTGFVNAPSYIGRQLVIQRSTPREMRGRVNSAFFVVRDTMFVMGMALAGIADLFDVRTLFLLSSLALLLTGLVVLVLPGLGQPAAQWRRTWALLKGVEAAPRLGTGRTATKSDVERFISRMPEMTGLQTRELDQLAAAMLVAAAPRGTVVVYRGETSDAAYFILKGRAAAGYLRDDEYVILNYLEEGEFFGEVAALTGAERTANVITEEESEFLIIPSKVMRRLAEKYDALRKVFYVTMEERLKRIELVRSVSLDQQLLRELRTKATLMEYEKSLAEIEASRGRVADSSD
jgi:CRP-like cAMP-binding protein/predicted MFS family arabinose efflux permease